MSEGRRVQPRPNNLSSAMHRWDFDLQTESAIAPAVQLFDRLSFMISSGQYLPGSQLPSIRQLALWTGLHRNTIAKVYQNLKQTGLVEARGGAGVYVRQGRSAGQVAAVVEEFLGQGLTLEQIKNLFWQEIDWRRQCRAKFLVVVDPADLGVGEIIVTELQADLGLQPELITTTQLAEILPYVEAATILTSRYFYEQVNTICAGADLRLICLDIYRFEREIERLRQLPDGCHVGIVSVSTGILRVAASLIQGLRGDRLLVTTLLPQDIDRLQATVRHAQILITDRLAEGAVKKAIALVESVRLRPLELLVCQHYLAPEAIAKLKVELGNHAELFAPNSQIQ
ncbi:MAG: GntR family transcriptional regulator [Pseudanabaenaceae cyanobacterium bins.68]|nr:GntR family transcriptional regulator [Pseudanabaenaceae cyanobacterium bins.68]